MAASLMMRTAGRLVCLGTTRARASLSGPPASAAHCRAPARASTLRQARWNGSAARAPPGGGAGTATGEGAEQASKSFADRAVGYWLLGCCGMTAGAVVLGGVTRLTESGLSMVSWHPVKGVKPPTTAAEWEEEFEAYKQFPEYKYMGAEMTLADFKKIFYMEWAHRIWGRMVGVIFTVPLVGFWANGWIRPRYKPVLLGLGGLIGFQGVLGYLMVKSGLDFDPEGAHVPRVSQYRLCAHLSTAFALYLGCLWTGLSHLSTASCTLPVAQLTVLRRFAHGTVGLAFVTAMSGAFVAGLDAGLVYNEFPWMGEAIIPSDYFALDPTWKNLFENPSATQFDHRLLGTSTGVTVLALWAYTRRLPLHPRAMMAVNAMVGMVGVQISLGIATLLYFVPTSLAAAHQSGSLTLLTLATWFLHELRKAPK